MSARRKSLTVVFDGVAPSLHHLGSGGNVFASVILLVLLILRFYDRYRWETLRLRVAAMSWRPVRRWFGVGLASLSLLKR